MQSPEYSGFPDMRQPARRPRPSTARATLSVNNCLTRRPRRGSPCHPDCGLHLACRPSRQQQVGDIGASNEQHYTGKRHQQSQALSRVLCQSANSACGRQHQCPLLRNPAAVAVPHAGSAFSAIQPLLQFQRDLRFHMSWRNSRLQATHHVQPVKIRLVQQRELTLRSRFNRQRQPEVRGRLGQPDPKKFRGANSHNGERKSVEGECRSDNRRIAGLEVLPGALAHYTSGGAPA